MSQSPPANKNTTPNSLPVPHVVTPPGPGQDYFSVSSGRSGHEHVRCATQAEAVREKARLDKLG